MKMVMIFNLHVVVAISYTQSVIHLVSLPPKNNLPLGTYIVWGTPIITYIGDLSITPPPAMYAHLIICKYHFIVIGELWLVHP